MHYIINGFRYDNYKIVNIYFKNNKVYVLLEVIYI